MLTQTQAGIYWLPIAKRIPLEAFLVWLSSGTAFPPRAMDANKSLCVSGVRLENFTGEAGGDG